MPVTGLLGTKIGMTQLYLEDGRVVPVTALQAGPCYVTQVRTGQNDGYEAVQLGFEETRKLNRPERGHTRRTGKQFRHLREFPLTGGLADIQVGQRVDASLFQPGDLVDITGTSKGRGFAGVVKRHGFRGGPKTHGQSDRWRAPGSIGNNTFPARVIKGKRMAGHMGAAQVTARNLQVVRVDAERNLLFIRGSVPGASRGLVLVRRAKSTLQRAGR